MEVQMKIIMLVTATFILSSCTTSHAGVNHSEFIETQCITGEDVTRTCLECHEETALEFMDTAHWMWKGETPFLKNHESDSHLGKINLMNDY